jgi:transcriptional regulator with XRE-family HTH domain
VKKFPKQVKVFSARVKLLRKTKGITQADLAGLMDVDIKTVKRLESGDYNPTLLTILSLANALGMNPKELF